MAVKQIRVSDLTGAEIPEDNQRAQFIIQRHPSYPEGVRLEVLDVEVEDKLDTEQDYVLATYYPSDERGGGEGQNVVFTLEQFESLFEDFDIETVLQEAHAAQEEAERPRRRGRRGKRGSGERRARVDYASPEHAGEPHRGQVRDAEKEYVRNNLAEVNARLERDGYRTIDPEDPEMAQRYELFSVQ
jgi:hypothetical protein